MDGFAGRHRPAPSPAAAYKIEAPKVSILEERFFGGRSHGMGMTTASVLFFKGLGGSLHFVDIGICFDGTTSSKVTASGPSAFPSGPLNRRPWLLFRRG